MHIELEILDKTGKRSEREAWKAPTEGEIADFSLTFENHLETIRE